jgi:hypothetical protein
LYKVLTISLVIIALATLATMTTSQVVKAQVSPTQPNEDGSCDDGGHMTRAGCCPEGMTNVHTICDTQEHHAQVSNDAACKAYTIVGKVTGNMVANALGQMVC